MRPDREPVAVGDTDQVGEVVLALGVVVADPRQRRGQEAGVQRQDAAVDLAYGGLLGGGVLLLDDGGDRAGGVADDPAVAERILGLAGQHGQGATGRAVVGHQRLQRLALEQRGVAVHHHDRAVIGDRPRRAAGERVEGDPDRVPGAVLGLLHRDERVGGQREDVRLDLLALVADHRDEVFRLERLGGGDDVPDQAATADGVQHLRGLGPHPRPAACREQDHGSGTWGYWVGGFGHLGGLHDWSTDSASLPG